MSIFLQLGYLAGEMQSNAGFKESFAFRIASQAPGFQEVRCNFIIPGSTVVAAHIAHVPPPPAYQYIAIITTDDPALPQTTASTFDVETAVRYRVARHASPSDRLGQGGMSGSEAEIRQLCLLKRRAGMTSAEFMDYYENNHAPLAEKYLPTIASYTRYFVQDVSAPEFDVITEICFANGEDHAQFLANLADPVIGEMFARDEEKLFDRASVCLLLAQQVIAKQP